MGALLACFFTVPWPRRKQSSSRRGWREGLLQLQISGWRQQVGGGQVVLHYSLQRTVTLHLHCYTLLRYMPGQQEKLQALMIDDIGMCFSMALERKCRVREELISSSGYVAIARLELARF